MIGPDLRGKDVIIIGRPPGGGDRLLGHEMGRELRQELNDTGLALGGETGPDLGGVGRKSRFA